MAKKTVQDNWRVEVWPSHSWTRRVVTKDDADGVLRQIKRHVDGYDSAIVQCDTYEACEFCGRAWEEDEDGPMCCTKAQVEWNQDKAAIAAAKGESA